MVRIGGDIGGIELEAGDTITVNGNDWVYQSDGTLEGQAISVEKLLSSDGTNQSSEQLIDSHADSDTGTPFDYDTGVLSTTAPFYKILIQIQDQNSSVLTDTNCRVNGVTDTVYYYNVVNSGVVSEVTMNDKWVLGTTGGDILSGELLLTGVPDTASSGSSRPNIMGPSGGRQDEDTLLNGEVRSTMDPNQIRIWTADNATGDVAIFGVDPIV